MGSPPASASASASAPGKVLLTGGYLVLDRRFSGLVVAVDARFSVSVSVVPASATTTPATTPAAVPIAVRSPQFTDGAWDYAVTLVDGLPHLSPAPAPAPGAHSPARRNPFVETALLYVLLVAAAASASELAERLGSGLTITVLADNDFYSQAADLQRRGLPVTVEALKSLPPHNATHGPVSAVAKTGLGSSAAMTTAVIAALCAHFGLATTTPIAECDLVYNLAQLAHCVAQGKIGSGFDVSSAVRGSHAYRRFSPALLDPVFNAAAAGDLPALAATVVSVVRSKWDWDARPFVMPKRLSLMLGDVAAGSNTPQLVSKVLAWRKAQPSESEALWTRLDALNLRVQDGLGRLTELQTLDPAAYDADVSACAAAPADRWASLPTTPVIGCLVDIYTTFQGVRACLREMTDASTAPIEPVEQSRLLDACMAVPGVLMAGVPGAGGYDAIFCIVLSDDARLAVHSLWSSWTETRVVPLLCAEAHAGLLTQ
ncbi:ribosomal protein S5 domain 2-type protein [Entophlyctis helioformis]|nr:ribosomal protein S5 domain 2-type protein [Entophlyctis helioformis]